MTENQSLQDNVSQFSRPTDLKITGMFVCNLRGLPMDFPDQLALRDVDDTYMFGPAFLVQPITKPMFNAEIMIDERMILRRIEHFQQRR